MRDYLACLALLAIVANFEQSNVVVEAASSSLRALNEANNIEPDITTEEDGEFWSRYLYAYHKSKRKFKPPLNKWTFAPTEMSISEMPSVQPSASPSATPSASPSAAPSAAPSATPSATPSAGPSETPS
eukprot:scaffold34594_cov165-Amphora_coffeaeformis.AAC.9